MKHRIDASANESMPTRKPHVLLETGTVTSIIWKTVEDNNGDPVRFRLFRTDSSMVDTTQEFTASDLPDLVRLAHFLATVLSEEDGLEPELRDDLACLAACLDDLMPDRSWSFAAQST